MVTPDTSARPLPRGFADPASQKSEVPFGNSPDLFTRSKAEKHRGAVGSQPTEAVPDELVSQTGNSFLPRNVSKPDWIAKAPVVQGLPNFGSIFR